MLRPHRALALAAEAEALPRVDELEQLYAFGFVPRRGQILMIAGPPGSGKSALGLWWAEKMKLPTLYFCADMDAHTATTRQAALLTDNTVEMVAQAIEVGAGGYYEDVLSESQVSFCFDSSPTLDDMADELSAYVELFDRYPELIVIDNAMNVDAQLGEDHAGLRLVFSESHRMARETNAAVMVLHHVREEGTLTMPAPRDKISGKVSQLPERILTVALDPADLTFRIAPVKNRGGKQDPTAKMLFELTAVPEKATFKRYVPQVWWGGQ